MRIRNEVREWAYQENKASQAWWWMMGILAIWSIAVFTVVKFGDISWIFNIRFWAMAALLFAATMYYVMWAPKVLEVPVLFGNQADSTVPDSLLSQIADSDQIPVWAKAEIAAMLQRKGSVTFRNLEEIDDLLTAERQAQRNARGAGFQKLAAFANRPGGNE